MSRINDGYEPDDTANFLRSCAFSHNVEQALKGKKGQKFLHELEASLLALSEKRLVSGLLARSEVVIGDGVKLCGDVCALGAVALKRRMDAGVPREIALQELATDFKQEEEDCDWNGWQMIEESAHLLKISMPLAYNVVEDNDNAGPHDETPEQRYERVLRWCRRNMKALSGDL